MGSNPNCPRTESLSWNRSLPQTQRVPVGSYDCSRTYIYSHIYVAIDVSAVVDLGCHDAEESGVLLAVERHHIP